MLTISTRFISIHDITPGTAMNKYSLCSIRKLGYVYTYISPEQCLILEAFVSSFSLTFFRVEFQFCFVFSCITSGGRMAENRYVDPKMAVFRHYVFRVERFWETRGK